MQNYDQFSASHSSLGYDYQIRLALLKAFELNLNDSIYVETRDDVEILKKDKRLFLSLKHKKEGNKLTNLSLDFWKSVNIWIDRYITTNDSQFYLITTETISSDSLLNYFNIENKTVISDEILTLMLKKLNETKNKLIIGIKNKLNDLTKTQIHDFFNRITICPGSIRIIDIPNKIKHTYLTAANIDHIDSIYERLEGWWFNTVINCMSNNWKEIISKSIIIRKINEINEEYFTDALPILFEDITVESFDIQNYLENNYSFVKKVKEIDLKSRQIDKCILDYYRATNERINWIRSALINLDELERYERLLIDEWERFKDNIYDETETYSKIELIQFGKDIFSWAQDNHFQIRPKVTQKYISRGTFHILADDEKNIIYWLPR